MNEICFPKLSKHDRTLPATWAIPLAAGELMDPDQFALMDGDHSIPCQRRVTGRWPDSSVKWLFVQAIVELPGNAAKRFRFDVGGARPANDPPHTVRLRQSDDGSIAVDTGKLRCTIPVRGFWPIRSVVLPDRPAANLDCCQGFKMNFGGTAFDSTEFPVRLTVEESGPLRAVVRVDSEFTSAPNSPTLRARLVFWAGSAEVSFSYTVTSRNPEINHHDDVRDWRFDLQFPDTHGIVRVAKGHYLDVIQRSDDPGKDLRAEYTAEHILGTAFELPADCYLANTWAHWQGADSGVLVSVKHAAQNFPKAYNASLQRISVELYPSSERDPLEWFAGTAKTHEFLLSFYDSAVPEEMLSATSLQFHMPDVPVLSPERFRHAGVWLPQVFGGPESQRAVRVLSGLGDQRTMGLGIFNFGDEYDYGYTNQGRGWSGVDEGDRLVWLNNEYDLSHHFFLFFARTGLRRFLDYAINTAQHWMDVDINHSSENPRVRNGHVAHCRRHAGDVKVGPSHQWVQGLFDAYHFTGNPDAYASAVGIADNIAYQTEHCGYLERGGLQTREMGWALRAMLSTWIETGEEKYRRVGDRIVALFRDWAGGGGAMLAPYTSHTSVRVPFMNGLTGVSLALWHLATGDPTAKTIALAIADDIIENATLPTGLPFYKELPGLQAAVASVLVVELYSYAYRLSGERKYLEAGLVPLEASLGSSQGITRVKRTMKNGIYVSHQAAPQGGKVFAQSLVGILQFIAVANSAELVRSIDCQLRL